jgi:SAM-dependent methyltransferase
MSTIIKNTKQLQVLIKESLKLNHFSITTSLSDFYTKTSVKRSNTRKRPWPEFEHIISEIQSYISKKYTNDLWKSITILELGCGDWRLAEYIDQQWGFVFRYIGVDCSHWLIDIARSKDYSSNNISFYVWDMLSYLQYVEQDSIDIIISIASIQHLHQLQRQLLWNESYRVLSFLWKHITINRSYSWWLLKKHRKSFVAWFFACIWNWKTFWFWDVLIPFIEPKIKKHINKSPLWISLWKDEGIIKKEFEMYTSYRFYHFFTLSELKRYITRSWLIASKYCYINDVWQMSDKLRQSRNTFVIWEKDIISDN